MFLNGFRTGATGQHEHLFVAKVTIRRPLHPVDAFIVIGWGLILTKCALASVAIHYWDIPIQHAYIWGPSVIFGAVCTLLHLKRDDR